MNKVKLVLYLSLIIGSIILACMHYQHRISSQRVCVYTGDSFFIPHETKNLALLGCTPHPSAYLARYDNNSKLLSTITLNDFLDKDYLCDSFKRTFTLCKEHHIDHLLIAYLPIYYLAMYKQLGTQFVKNCRTFLDQILKEIPLLIEQIIREVDFKGKVTLIAPPDYQLSRVPSTLENLEERFRYLIKQFPTLKNLSESALEKITIINNKASQEDDALIDYLKYEYLYEKRVIFEKLNIEKERFHEGNKALL